ncbi:UvrD-helicase domain-containing protein [Paraburkholderia caribensis]|uniref:UvrD-helicase domain-containing protein n=1 Tax=Paraburkholderia caribensis TaxID=75105 RepID=UPI001D099751|nr:UvrD-helicase domain-containing protein [Paraburkholderia caribensis]
MAQVFKPTSWGLAFTGSRKWVLRIDAENLALELTLEDKCYQRDIDEDDRVAIHRGIFWAALTVQINGTQYKVDGFPTNELISLQNAITKAKEYAVFRTATRLARESLEHRALFNAEYNRVLAWLKERNRREAAIRARMVWVPYEDWQEMLRSRPTLKLNDHELLSHVRDPANHSSLDDPPAVAELTIRIWQGAWIDLLVTKNAVDIASEKNWPHGLFERVEKKPLTRDQIRAVMMFDNRMLVVASAGSGKTSTMVAKAVYAVHQEIVRPEQILLLAFNKPAADELGERSEAAFKRVGLQGVKVEARTFHAHGLAIIGKATGRKPNVPDWTVDAAAGMRKLSDIVDGLKDKSTDFRTKWDLFRIVFGRDMPGFGNTTAADGWDKDGTGYVRTIRGERVRSHEERVICDYLFYNGVNYEYERKYEFDTATADHRQYFPDFYYPDVGLYHEHFALDASGKPPEHFTDYLAGIRWKRAEHARRGTKLIETTSHEVRSRSLDTILGKKLTAHGIKLDPNPDRSIPEGGHPPMENEKLARLVRVFIVHMKSNSLTVDTLIEQLKSESDDAFMQRHMMFLEIVHPVLRAWDDALMAEEGIDFEDMLNQAATHLETGRYESPFELVMADEFQDASRARARLCRALVARPKRFFFAVGDDWQSINRFAGADISVMTDFRQWFGHSELLKLEQTFRCPQQLCDASSRFISKNPKQITKRVSSETTSVGPVLRALQVTHRSELREAINTYLAQLYRDLSAGVTPLGDGGKVAVFVLGRYRKDATYLPTNWQARYGRLISLEFRTMHRSKGAEADYVILPAMLTRAFPSTRVDDPVLAMAMPAGDTFPLSEERRLFYVALTRARRSVAMFTVKGESSSFLDELVKDGAVTVEAPDGETVKEERCPACETGVIIPREGPYGVFYACSSYPRCEFKPRQAASQPKNGATPYERERKPLPKST